ncbi:MAG: hypothetical protein ICV60_22110 [Pyrinomonadaceae bacterium]|nr:hypothetical protein [Pyrinomonadaceae bacterium]
MARFNSPLDNVRVSAPCSSDWNQMIGDERVRFCRHCSLNVYNLSGMTRREAESLIANAEGHLCVRYYRRRDGTILTKNCPVGLSAITRRISRTASAMLSAVLGFFAGLGIYAGTAHEGSRVHVRTMGTLTAPEKASVNIRPEPPSMLGTYMVEEGQADIPAGDYIVGRKIPKKARR